MVSPELRNSWCPRNSDDLVGTRPGDMALDLALIQRPDKPDLQFRPVRRGSSDQDRIDFSPLPTHCTAHKVDVKIQISLLWSRRF
jgi:hypothetical protein